MMLAYDPISHEKRFSVDGEFRRKGTDTLDLSAVPAGTYHIYAAFVAVDRSRQSDSLYLGSVEIVD